MCRFFLIVLGLLSANGLFSQQSCKLSVSVQVVDIGNNSPLPFASVRIVEPPLTAVSDLHGVFRFEGLCQGKYTLVTSLTGSLPDTVRVLLSSDSSIIIRLTHQAQELSEIQVAGDHDHADARLRFDISEQHRIETYGRPLADVLIEVPGVTVLRTGSTISKPVIHGLHSNRVLILNNGIRQEGQQWGYEHAPEIDPFIADEIEIIKGASSLCYGHDAIAGVVLVKPKTVHTQKALYGAVSLSGASNGRGGASSAIIGGGVPKINGLSWRLQGTLKGAGNMHTPDYFIANTGLREQNFSWSVGYLRKRFGVDVFYSQFNTDIGIFSGSHIGNLTDLMAAVNSEQPAQTASFTYALANPRQRIEHELTKANAFWYLNEDTKLMVTYARQFNNRQEFDLHRSNDTNAGINANDMEFSITTHTAQIQIETELTKKLELEAGVSGLHQKNTWAGRYFIPSFVRNATGGFLVFRYRPSKHWMAEAGLRYDVIQQQVFYWEGGQIVSPEFSYGGTALSAGAVYKASEKVSILLTTASNWRPPAINEMYSNGLHHGSASIEVGERNLSEERAWNGTIGAIWQTEKIQIQGDVYVHYFDGFIYLQPDSLPALTIKGAFPVFNFMQSNALLYGTDLMVSWTVASKLILSAKGSLVRHRNLSTNDYLPLMPSDRISGRITWNWSLTKSGLTGYFAAHLDQVFRQSRFSAGDLIVPPKGYTLAGVFFGVQKKYRETPIDIVFGVSNLFNARYRDYLDRFRYFTDQPGRNVTISVKVPFGKSYTKQEKL